MASFLAPLARGGRWHSKLKGSYAIPSPRKTVTTTTSRHACVAVRSASPHPAYLRVPPARSVFCAQVSDQCGGKRGKRGYDEDCFCFALRDESNIDRILRLRFGTDSANAPTPTFVKVAQEVSQAQVVQPPRH